MRKKIIAWLILLGFSISAVALGGAVQSALAADPPSRLVVFEGFYRPT
jgi:hypothetical protein